MGYVLLVMALIILALVAAVANLYRRVRALEYGRGMDNALL